MPQIRLVPHSQWAAIVLALCLFTVRAAADTVTTTVLGKGVVLRQCVYTSLYNSPQLVDVFDADLNEPSVKVSFPWAKSKDVLYSIGMKPIASVACVLGQPFDAAGPVAFFKTDGTVRATTRGASVRDELGITVDSGNVARIVAKPAGGWETLATIPNIFTDGPALVIDGADQFVNSTDPGMSSRIDRECAAWTTDNHLLLIRVIQASAYNVNPVGAGQTGLEMQQTLHLYGSIRSALFLHGGTGQDAWTKLQPPPHVRKLQAVNAVTISALYFSLATSPYPIIGGDSASVAVTLSQPADQDYYIGLVSSDATVKVPDALLVRAGERTGQAPLQTPVVTSDVSAIVTASAFGMTFQAGVYARVQPLGTLTIANRTLVGGEKTAATLTLDPKYRPPDGTVLTISATASVVVPQTIVVQPGVNIYAFDVTTSFSGSYQSQTVSVSLGNRMATSTLSVAPVVLEYLYFTPNAVRAGENAVGTILLNREVPVADGMPVHLSSSDPLVVVPAVVTVPQGSASTDFPVSTLPFAGQKTAIITASVDFASIASPFNLVDLEGDTDLNGTLDMRDVALLLRRAAGIAPATPDQVIQGDADYDLSLTLADAITLLQRIESRVETP